jgi:type I restriction-modification system DNA methylase subunit
MPAPATRAEARLEVERLVERFARNLEAYKRTDYKETRVRVEFIDPMFEALGWDVRNVYGYAEQYKDVVHEDALKVGGATRAPDYCFRIGGVRKFFLEVKKPAVWIKEDIGPAYQLRRYAWSAKLPLSILTDFEEFAVYDCRQRPKPADRVSTGRVTYVTFDQYLDRFDDIYGVFAKESVLQGSFDRYVQDTKRKRGTSEVDAEFLKEIEGWRDALAHNIALRNPALSVHELNFAVQRTIDRIIFLRMCEDRSIEEYGRLLALTGGPHVYARLHDLYRQADEKYNAGLFDFRADTLSKTLAVDDRVLKPILAGLYYPQSPYEFSVLPADILGQVYEQFLGKVIRLTPAHRARVEEKPEVKKAGGVYYTPTYVVDYIVQQTVGRLVEGKTPRQISKLRCLDPACGSGSFLLGAYQYLLDYHRQWYEAHDPARHAGGKRPALYQGHQGEWRLTTAEKKRILLNNIYGVDIDRQAVEVTKLSLLLKVLEGESQETLGQQLTLWRERALPDLGDNVKCGNSLIGPDYFEAQLLPDEEEMRRVNPFDWEGEFPEVMAAGGFDCVIGNPPWGADFSDGELDYLRKIHQEIIVRMIDSYIYFVHRSAQLLNCKGVFGMIIPSTLLTQSDVEALRRFLVDTCRLQTVVNLGQRVFGPKVLNTSTILVFATPDAPITKQLITVGDLRHCTPDEKQQRLQEVKAMKSEEWLRVVLSDPACTYFTLNLPGVALFQRLVQSFPIFQDMIDGKIQRGISPDYAEAFIVEDEIARQEQIEEQVLRPVVLGRHVSRYGVLDSSTSILYLTRKDDINKYPNAKAHLSRYRNQITCREVAEGRHPWFALHRPRDPSIFEAPKFIGLTTTRQICVALDEEFGYYATDALYLFRIKPSLPIQECFVLGVLHSTCFQFLYQVASQREQRVIPQVKAAKLYGLPFPFVDTSDSTARTRHDRMVALVERMLALHKKLDAASIPGEKALYQRQIEATDRQIDALVYELYGLTEEEIAIVEGG